MVALLDLDDLIVAIGRAPATAEEAAQWQFEIDSISEFINNYVDVSFSSVAETIRYKADYYGVVDLGGDPVSTVTSVKDWLSQKDVSYNWDGIGTINNLCPNQVVDILYTHGYSAVPDDIKYLATKAVKEGLELGATGAVTSFTVGDVTEVYAKPIEGGPNVVTLQKSTLDKYTKTFRTWRLGDRNPVASPINSTVVIN